MYYVYAYAFYLYYVLLLTCRSFKTYLLKIYFRLQLYFPSNFFLFEQFTFKY